MIEAPQSSYIMKDAALEESDKKLLGLVKSHLLDMLENSYCGFVEQIAGVLQRRDNEVQIEEYD